MTALKYKVFAYITHADRLLVFRHPTAPEAGIQVPAGTIQAGEPPAVAVLREAWEETGLVGLTLDRLLGAHRRPMVDFGRDEVHHRYFYHLRCPGTPPATWRHWERDPADGGPPIPFDFFWAPLPDGVPDLIADHGYMLPRLCAVLSLPPRNPAIKH